MTNILEGSKREHNELGYQAGATQHIAPFLTDKGWFTRGYSNVYSIADYRISIRHCYMIANKMRWTNVFKWRDSNAYIVEIYDSIEIDGTFYDKTIFKASTDSLKMAVHLANIHKSDK